jgi:predicted flap endonuclease-1-like 5' DNA nuclease
MLDSSSHMASMGDERGSANEGEKPSASGSEALVAPIAPRAVVQLPRAVSLPPRPSSGPTTVPRPLGTPPPPPVRTATYSSQQPPPAPLRTTTSAPPLPPSMRPPAPSMRPSGSPPPAAAPLTSAASVRPDGGRVQELLAELMTARKELTQTVSELRKVISERNALRIQLAQAEISVRELASASRAEALLRAEFVDAHAASSAALRLRVSELEAALAAASVARSAGDQPSLRQIRGIGPSFERGLLALGITNVSQIAALGTGDIERIAPLLRARADRILRDDWVGQAKRLLGE